MEFKVKYKNKLLGIPGGPKFCTFSAEGTGSIPGQGPKILLVVKQKKKVATLFFN